VKKGLVIALAIVGAAPALAIGMGPLVLDGVIDGPREGFQLTVLNPYEEPETFVAYAVSIDGEETQSRVTVIPSEMTLGGGRDRKLLVVADDLKIGESYKFRVCAQRKTPPEGIMLNARVCSKITAHRIS
jgi:hypothetical protein